MINTKLQLKKTKNWFKLLSISSLFVLGVSCSDEQDFEVLSGEDALLSAKVNEVFEAEDYNSQSGIQTVGTKVGYVNDGDWIKFDDFDHSGATSITVTAASGTSGGTIEFRKGSATGGNLLAEVDVSGTGGWNNMQEFTANITGSSSNSDLYVVFTGGSGYLLDIDNFTFGSSTVTPISEGGTSFPDMVGETIRLQSSQSNNYWLRISGTATGDNLEMTSQSSTGSWPRWTVEEVTSGNETYYRFVNANTGARFRPVDDSNGSAVYNPINTWTGNWTQWAVESDGNGNYTLRNRTTGNYLSSLNSVGSTPTTVSSLNGSATTWNIVDLSGDDINGEGSITTGGGDTPYEVLGLDRWKITLPKDEGGDSDADEVYYNSSDNDYSGDAALPNYSDEFFYVNDDGNVVFECPADDDLPKTSSGTSNTRTELREMPYRSGDEDGWDAGGSTVREMSFRARVMQTSSTRKLAFAQIHDFGEDNWDDLIRIQIQSDDANATVGDNGKIYIMGDMAEGLSSEGIAGEELDDRTILANYTLGDWMDFRVTYNNDIIRIYLGGSLVKTYTGADCPSNYFKAGVYNQSMSSSSSGTGIVEFQSLSVSSNF